MTMNDTLFAQQAEIGRRLKAEAVRKFGKTRDPEDADIMGYCSCVRNGRPTFLVYHGEGPFAMRECVFWSALTTQCSEIFVVSDARYKVLESLDEGLPAPGGLQDDWEAGRRDGIHECLSIYRFPFIGEPTSAQYPYVREGTKLTWGKIMYFPNAEQSGAIWDAARTGWAKRREIEPGLIDRANAIGRAMKLTEAEQRNHQDWGIGRYLSRQKSVFMVDYMPDEVFFIDGETLDEKGLGN